MPKKDETRKETPQGAPAITSKQQRDEDVNDFAGAGEAEANVAPKLSGKKRKKSSNIEDPRDDIFIPEVVNEDMAREAAESEYVSPDQPLDELPKSKRAPRKSASKNASAAPRKSTPGR
jgi:hypothetical protein